jgi:hypothetical protein
MDLQLNRQQKHKPFRFRSIVGSKGVPPLALLKGPGSGRYRVYSHRLTKVARSSEKSSRGPSSSNAPVRIT